MLIFIYLYLSSLRVITFDGVSMVKLLSRLWQALLLVLLIELSSHIVTAERERETTSRLVTAPHRNAGAGVIDGSGTEHFNSDKSEDGEQNIRVSVSTVALCTLAMAAATGLGAIPFFFFELDPQWAGICNGVAAGVMLAASFDLIQEGQGHGSGSWVVSGILSGGVFIWFCKKVLFFEHVIKLYVHLILVLHLVDFHYCFGIA